MPYTAVADAVKNLHACRTMISNKSNCAIKSLFNDGECVIMPSIAEEMKAVKNSAEIAGFHDYIGSLPEQKVRDSPHSFNNEIPGLLSVRTPGIVRVIQIFLSRKKAGHLLQYGQPA